MQCNSVLAQNGYYIQWMMFKGVALQYILYSNLRQDKVKGQSSNQRIVKSQTFCLSKGQPCILVKPQSKLFVLAIIHRYTEIWIL